MKEIIQCKCCKKRIPNYGTNKYCTSCSLYLKNIVAKMRYYKRKAEILNIKIYGTKNGNERIRFSNSTKFQKGGERR